MIKKTITIVLLAFTLQSCYVNRVYELPYYKIHMMDYMIDEVYKLESKTGHACEYDLPCRCPKCINENDTITK